MPAKGHRTEFQDHNGGSCHKIFAETLKANQNHKKIMDINVVYDGCMGHPYISPLTQAFWLDKGFVQG